MKRFTIADGEFMPYGRSRSLGWDNLGDGPNGFEWEIGDPGSARFVTDRYIKDARGSGQVAWLCEPFFLHPENYLDAMKKPFEAVLTHERYFEKNMGWLWAPHGGSYIRKEEWGILPKTKNVSIVGSYKNTTFGHRVRQQAIHRFGGRMDGVYGMDGYTRKFECLAPYRFSVVIENECGAGFFTEKIIDCFSVGTIPIYWGAPDIADYFDPEGMIQFVNLDQLEHILSCINEELYLERMESIQENLFLAEKYRCSDDWIFLHHPHLFTVT